MQNRYTNSRRFLQKLSTEIIYDQYGNTFRVGMGAEAIFRASSQRQS